MGSAGDCSPSTLGARREGVPMQDTRDTRGGWQMVGKAPAARTRDATQLTRRRLARQAGAAVGGAVGGGTLLGACVPGQSGSPSAAGPATLPPATVEVWYNAWGGRTIPIMEGT